MPIVTDLQPHILRLATLDESASPVVSCYLSLETGPSGYRHALDMRARQLRASLSAPAHGVAAALERIDDFVGKQLLAEATGAAIFARGGVDAFFLPLQFRVPLPTWVAVGATPNIYHLVELKDTYDRFVVLLASETRVQIVEANLGAVTLQLFKERPELRKRVGREWTRAHYQSHARERTDRFAKEAVAILDRLMSAGGHTHLFLAGSPRATARVRDALPRHLQDTVVEPRVAARSDRLSDTFALILASFVEQEERESQAVVEQLRHALHANGLAAVGADDTLRALQRSAVDVLVLASAFDPGPGRVCRSCGTVSASRLSTSDCSGCGASLTRSLDLKEEMVRLAQRSGCHVEVVTHSDLLMQFGGVGALLRFLVPDACGRQPMPKAMSVSLPG